MSVIEALIGVLGVFGVMTALLLSAAHSFYKWCRANWRGIKAALRA